MRQLKTPVGMISVNQLQGQDTNAVNVRLGRKARESQWDGSGEQEDW
jgi:hypothetical protein